MPLWVFAEEAIQQNKVQLVEQDQSRKTSVLLLGTRMRRSL